MPSEIMKYFKYAHLPAALKGISHAVAAVAELMDKHLPDGAEKSAGLRKLLEAKDCFVRSAVDMPHTVKIGELSDGYHTIDELYAHRMNLFAVICRQNHVHAWKSKLHHDGTMFDDYFIVGVETPMGQFTYHYPMLHWGMFQVRELEKAPEWDGHTSDDVVRLHSLKGTAVYWDLDVTNDHIDAVGYAVASLSNENREALLNGYWGRAAEPEDLKFIGRRAAETAVKNSAKLGFDLHVPFKSRDAE